MKIQKLIHDALNLAENTAEAAATTAELIADEVYAVMIEQGYTEEQATKVRTEIIDRAL